MNQPQLGTTYGMRDIIFSMVQPMEQYVLLRCLIFITWFGYWISQSLSNLKSLALRINKRKLGSLLDV
jgi:hypothetical protein